MFKKFFKTYYQLHEYFESKNGKYLDLILKPDDNDNDVYNSNKKEKKFNSYQNNDNNNDKKIINIINQLKNFDFFEEKNNKKFYNDQINQMNKQIDELLLYKKNNEIIKDNNENLINKNKILESDINILKENINLNEIKKKELNDYIINLKKEIFLLENKLGEAKVYVVKNFSENERKIEKFFELIGNTNDQNK
jgi:hypothetical protein